MTKSPCWFWRLTFAYSAQAFPFPSNWFSDRLLSTVHSFLALLNFKSTVRFCKRCLAFLKYLNFDLIHLFFSFYEQLYWFISDCLVTAWWLPGDCLMTVRWQSDDWYWLKLAMNFKIPFMQHFNWFSYTVFLQKDQPYDVLRHQLPQNWKPEPDSTNTSATSSTGHLFSDYDFILKN